VDEFSQNSPSVCRRLPYHTGGSIMKESKLTNGFFKLDNCIVDQYMPYIGNKGLTLYVFYKRMYNKSKGCAYPSTAQITERLNISAPTVRKYNKLLEKVGLIKKDRGVGRMHNQYRILKPDILRLNRHILMVHGKL
jgi:replication initiation and membrane attachment protein DnaB